MRRAATKKNRNNSSVSSYETLEPRELMAADLSSTIAIEPSNPVVHLPIQAEVDDDSANGLGAIHDTYGLTGVGQTVVIIDGGVAYDHFALGGGFGEEYRVVGGWDFAENDADPYDDAPRGMHGTHVAGVLASSDETYPGVAPGTDIVALRVFDDNAAGDFTWIENALSWVHANKDSFENPITTVNLSVGTDWHSDTVPIWAQLEQELRVLEDDGIFTAVSAGNGFRSNQTVGLSYPAVSPYVVPVGSVNANGDLSAFSQRHDRVLLAPGELITSTVPDYINGFDGVTDDFARSSGTSFAGPYIAGSSVLVREAFEISGVTDITQDLIYEHLRKTADEVYDPITDADYLRVNLDRAIEAALPEDLVGDTLDSALDLGSVDSTELVTGWANSAIDTDVFTFTAEENGSVRIVSESDVSGLSANRLGGTESGVDFTFDVVAGETYAWQVVGGDMPGTFQSRLEFTVAEVVEPVVDPVEAPVEEPAVETPVEETPESPIEETQNGEASNDLDSREQPSTVPAEPDAPADAGNNAAFSIAATSGDDRIEIYAGEFVEVVVNGQRQNIGAQSDIVIHGATANDLVKIFGSSSNETATVFEDRAEISGDGWDLSVSGTQRLEIDGAGGDDSVTIHDGSGDDLLVAREEFTILLGAEGRNLRVSGFADTQVIASSGGRDVAILHDSDGNDLYRFAYDSSTMTYRESTTNSKSVTVESFERVVGLSRQGGVDRAEAYGSAEAHRFVSRENASYLTGFQESHRAEGFAHVSAFGAENNTAWIYDSAEDDQLSLSQTGTHIRGGYSASVFGYEDIGALGNSGGHDTAIFQDSAGDDTFVSLNGLAILEGDGFRQVVNGYEEVTAVSTSGNDRAVLYGSEQNGDTRTDNGISTTVTSKQRTHTTLKFSQIDLKGSFASAAPSLAADNGPVAQGGVVVAAADPSLSLQSLETERVDEAIVAEDQDADGDVIVSVEVSPDVDTAQLRDAALRQPLPHPTTVSDAIVERQELETQDIDAVWDELG